MNPENDTLSERLREWKAPEPAADFEARVWSRIRCEPGAETPAGFWRFMNPAPVFSLALAALLAMAAGVSTALLSTPSRPGPGLAPAAWMHGKSLSGTYRALARGETP